MQLNQGYKTKEYAVPVKRYCQTLSLKNNPQLIAEYRKIHSRENAWPEIRKGIRSVGILEMEIYISGSLLFMIVDTPLDLPRQAEWEDCVARFQECAPGSTSSQKWKLMERMFYLYD